MQNKSTKLDISLSLCSAPACILTTLSHMELLSKDQISIIEKERDRTQKSLSEVIQSFGFISEKTLNEIITQHQELSAINLKNIILDPDFVSRIPHKVAEQKQMIAIGIENEELTLAMVNTYDITAIDQAKKYFPGYNVKPVWISSSQLNEAIDRYYGYELSIQGLLNELESKNIAIEDSTPPTSPIIRIVESFLRHGIKMKASDIHFQPEEKYVRVRYRLDGVLQQHCVFHKSYWSAIVVRLKVISQLNLAESKKPQSGRMSMFYGTREIDFRVSSHPTIHGESFVMRILDKQHAITTLENLGFTTEQVLHLKQLIQRPQGLFVLTGPTGCGKTTTLYSILTYLNSSNRNIMTLEQPVEYQIPMIRQTDVKELTQTTFAQGVRSILRQDPDVIFIGEIRDEETAQMALRAAMTGHLVFTTLHTHDSHGIVSRLKDLGLKSSMFADYLIASVSQRLLRLNCELCQGKGCDHCHHTGFKGRQAVAEILSFHDELKENVAADKPTHDLRKISEKYDFQSMKKIATQLVLQNKTTQREVDFHLGADHDSLT